MIDMQKVAIAEQQSARAIQAQADRSLENMESYKLMKARLQEGATKGSAAAEIALSTLLLDEQTRAAARASKGI